MRAVTDEAVVLARVVAWGEGDPRVRALILTSSRARGDETVDALSDYDVIVALDDVAPFLADESWIGAYARPLVRWGDESERLGLPTYFRGVVYEDGAKIDWSLWPAELLDLVRDPLPDQLDVGYRVLLDKDGRTREWPAAAYRAHVPRPPTEAEFRALFEELFWSATYCAKALWRGELFFARFCLDYDMRQNPLRTFLEWRMELDHDWSLKPGAYGRGIERLLPQELAAELQATYAARDAAETWEALDRTLTLFRRVAREVAQALGFTYPQEVDDGVTAYVRTLGGAAAADRATFGARPRETS